MTGAVLDRRALGAYGLMGLPLAFAGMPLYIHMPDLYVREWGLGLSAAALILLVLRCVDAAQDLVIGHVCDRYPARRGWFMAAGFLLLVAGMAAVFYGPPAAGMAAIWFAGAIALATLGLSVMNINMALIGGFWQTQPQGRLRVAAWRESFTLVGMILAAVLPGLLQLHMDAVDAFVIVFWVFAALAVAASFVFMRFWRAHGREIKMDGPVHVGGWCFFAGNKTFLGACFLTHLAAALPAALFLFFVRDYMGVPDAAGLFLLLYLGSGIAGMPLWQRLAARYGQERAWIAAMFLAIGAFGATLFMVNPDQMIVFALICVLSGAALGADLSIPPAMMAARLAARRQTEQGSRAFAVMNMIPKIALGVASGVGLLWLAQVGYRAGAADNSPAALWWLLVLYAGVPCALKAGAAFMLWMVEKRLNKGECNEISERSAGDGHYHVS